MPTKTINTDLQIVNGTITIDGDTVATSTDLETGLATKQDAGDYATVTYVDGLIGDIGSLLDEVNGEEI